MHELLLPVLFLTGVVFCGVFHYTTSARAADDAADRGTRSGTKSSVPVISKDVISMISGNQ